MKKIVFTIAFLGFIIYSFSQTERKFQIWNKNEIIIQPWNNVSIEVSEKIHYSPERNAADLKYGELALGHGLKKWFGYSAGFRITNINTYPGWIQEYRPMISADFMQSNRKLDIIFSNRFEYRIFETGLKYFRYRQPFLIELPKLASWGIQFYTSEESFYNFKTSTIHLFRIYTGVSIVQTEHFELKTYYSLEKSKPVEYWNTTDIAGFNMSFIL